MCPSSGMQIPVEITFRGMPRWKGAEELAREKAAELEKFFEKITSCRVMIEAPHRKGQKGQRYHVSIDLTVPGKEILVTHDPGPDETHEDLPLTIRDAFHAARRQLQDYVRERRGKTKHHEETPHARVARVGGDYGFLETPDGREVYFHRNAVLDDAFDELHVGTEVRYVEEPGEKGPQATTLRIVGRHGGL